MKVNCKTQIKTLIGFLCLTVSIFECYSVESLKWYTEDYPPFNYRSEGGKKTAGIAIELLEATHKNLYKKGNINKETCKSMKFKL